MIDVPIETGTPILADEIITALDALLLSGEDFDVWLEQTGDGLALMISTIEGIFTLCIYQSGAWQPSTDGGDTDSEAIETPAFLCPRSFRYGAPSPSSLVQVPNDAKEGFEDELIDLHYSWLQIVGIFVATGWRVMIEYLPPESFEDFGSVNIQATAPLSERTHHSVIQGAFGRVPETVIAVAKWCESGPDSWDFDSQGTGLAAGYEIWPRTAVHLEDYAIAVAPLWTLAPGIDQPLGHFPDTGAVRPTVDLSPPPRPGQEELDRRQEQIREWAMKHEFLREVRPAKAKAVRELLGREGVGAAGYYLLEFTSGECYVGQSTCIDKRLAQHLLKHPDIVSIRIKTDPEALAAADTLRHLLRRERALIHSAQKLGLLARNKSEMTVLIGKAQLDCSISPQEQAAWLSNPANKNRSDLDSGRVLDCASTVFAGADRNFANFSRLAGDEFPLVLGLIGQYLRKCIPHPNATEGHFWNISAPLSSYRGKAPWVSHTLCCLSVGWVETLVILKRVGSGEIHGFLQVNGTELFGDVNPDVAFLQLKRQHPGVGIAPAEYRDSGPDNWSINFSNLHVLARLLADPRVVRAAATTALLLMRVRRAPSTRQQTHCPQTVTAAWDQLDRDSQSHISHR